MAVTITSAENALKTVYLGVVSDQLNLNTNPLLARINQTTEDVWGKDVRKAAPIGLNGGFGAGTEDGALPRAAGNRYAQFTSALKNLYGQIEISDKAIRASASNAGAMVNLLNAELEGLLKASKFNLSRMLYGTGDGRVAKVTGGSTILKKINLESVKPVMEGMLVDVVQNGSVVADGCQILRVDRDAGCIYVDAPLDGIILEDDCILCVQGSYRNEITGIGAIFDVAVTELYGLKKSEHSWLKPVQMSGAADFSEDRMQAAIDKMEEDYNSAADMIICSSGVKRRYQRLMNAFKRNIDIMNLEGGYKAMSYNGIPVISDRFVEKGTMYILNTSEFTLHQLCDWKWLESENGRIITQVPGKPLYTATLVKYAELMCDKPAGQARIYDIGEDE